MHQTRISNTPVILKGAASFLCSVINVDIVIYYKIHRLFFKRWVMTVMALRNPVASTLWTSDSTSFETLADWLRYARVWFCISTANGPEIWFESSKELGKTSENVTGFFHQTQQSRNLFKYGTWSRNVMPDIVTGASKLSQSFIQHRDI